VDERFRKYYPNMAIGYDLCQMKVIYIWPLLAVVWMLSDCQRAPYQEGERLYTAHCANCHGEQGQGLGALIPPLAGSDYMQKNASKLACILVKGLSEEIVVNGKTYSGQPMPANETLTDIHVSNILNYINNSWGNHNGEVSLEAVRTMLKDCGK
jgi:cytochrome c551